MVRLKRLTISGFRGARYPLELAFTSGCKSIAIFGENASGKSTITDAVEWFFRERVDHLWREDCKEEALRNIHLDEKEDAIVSLEFNDQQLSAEKRLTKALAVRTSNKTQAFTDYIAKTADERLVLRTATLTEFINKRKGEKREEIARIIGYEALSEFRKVALAVLNSLEKHPDYINAKKTQAVAQARLMTLCGEVLFSEDKLFAKAGEIVQAFKPKTTITDEESYTQCIEDLRGKIAQQEKAEKRSKLSELKRACESLSRTAKTEGDLENTFLAPYSRLVRSSEKIKLLDVEQFLSKGKDILDKGLTEPGKCPFCGGEADFDHLRAEVTKRIRELESVRIEFQGTKSAKDGWVSSLKEVSRLSRECENRWAGLDVPSEFAALVKNVGSDALALATAIDGKFQLYQEIREDPTREPARSKLVSELTARIQKIDEDIRALQLTKEEDALMDAIQTLNDLRAAFGEYRQNTKTKEAFETQIRTLAKIKDDFIKMQNEAFQNVLDRISADVSKYYLALHPPKNENVDDVKLRIVGEEGVEFEYSFHGKKTYPPMKYLSESHLNALGLALFLASAKSFNKESNFLVLDDVVTSFDAAHRVRLLRLLQDEFKDRQILLLTHERHWFEIIKKEFTAVGWIIHEVDWSHENGVQLRAVPADLRELIILKRAQGHDVANDVRTLLEKTLKEICHCLQVKMGFRYNDRNEDRMVGELLSELRSTVNDKAPCLKDHPIFKQIETSNLLGTKGSHDRPKEVSKGDIDVAVEDIDKLEGLFTCEKCGQLVSRDWFIQAEKKITCRCGEKKLDWKG